MTIQPLNNNCPYQVYLDLSVDLDVTGYLDHEVSREQLAFLADRDLLGPAASGDSASRGMSETTELLAFLVLQVSQGTWVTLASQDRKAWWERQSTACLASLAEMESLEFQAKLASVETLVSQA